MSNVHHHTYSPDRAKSLLNPLRGLLQHPKYFLRSILKSGDRVLDLGCGPGFMAVRMAKMVQPGGTIVAADSQPEMLQLLEDEIHHRGLEGQIRLHLQPSPACLGLSGPFDVILAFYMLHEVQEKDHYLKQIRDVISPEGCFVMVEPRFVLDKDAFDREVDRVEKAGFRKLRRLFVPLSRGAVFVGG